MEDDSDMNILHIRLDEGNHRNVVLQNQCDDTHMGLFVSSQQMDICDDMFDQYDELYVAQRHTLEQSQIIALYVDQDAVNNLIRIRLRILHTLDCELTPLRYPDPSPTEQQKPPIQPDGRAKRRCHQGRLFRKGHQVQRVQEGADGPRRTLRRDEVQG